MHELCHERKRRPRRMIGVWHELPVHGCVQGDGKGGVHAGPIGQCGVSSQRPGKKTYTEVRQLKTFNVGSFRHLLGGWKMKNPPRMSLEVS